MTTTDTMLSPAYICWNSRYGHFVQFSEDDDAQWFDKDGNQIDRSELFSGQREHFRKGRLPIAAVEIPAEAVEALNNCYSPKGYAEIKMGDNEWGNELMYQIAREYFEQNPDADFVEVREHAGWFLGFRRDLSVWSTANDSARLQKPFPQPGGRLLECVRR
jgi:hypothetical protein